MMVQDWIWNPTYSRNADAQNFNPLTLRCQEIRSLKNWFFALLLDTNLVSFLIVAVKTSKLAQAFSVTKIALKQTTKWIFESRRSITYWSTWGLRKCRLPLKLELQMSIFQCFFLESRSPIPYLRNVFLSDLVRDDDGDFEARVDRQLQEYQRMAYKPRQRWSHKITIPQPFNMTIREETKPKHETFASKRFDAIKEKK